MVLWCTFGVVFSFPHASGERSFIIDHNRNKLLCYISGSIHYFRIPMEYWQGYKAKMIGLNAIQT